MTETHDLARTIERTTGYGLETPDGTLVRHRAVADADGTRRYLLTVDPEDPVLTLDTLRDLERLVYAPSVHAGGTEPREALWGDVAVRDCRAVEVTFETTVAPASLPARLEIPRPVEIRGVPRKLAERYTGADLDFLANPVLVIADLPAEIGREDAKAYIGCKVQEAGKPYARFLHAVGPVPEDYADLVGPNGVLMICGPVE